jgi:hypothetical protein
MRYRKNHFRKFENYITSNFITKILISFIFSIGVISAFGQVRGGDINMQYTILKDSIWLKKNHWGAINLLQDYKIIDSINALKTDFEILPVFRFRKNINHFDYSMKFIDIIEKDTTRVSGLIIQDSVIIGYLSGYKHNNNWFVLPIQAFTNDDGIHGLIINLKSKIQNKLFDFYPFNPSSGKLCYSNDDSIFVLNEYINRFMPVNEYIEKRIGLVNLNYYYLESDSDRNNIIR